MQRMNDHDMRQLNHMRDAIDAFLSGQLSIQGLVGTLSFLLENLESAPEEWKETFRQKWGLLEMLNAEAREARRPLTKPERQYAKNIVMEIKKLVENMTPS